MTGNNLLISERLEELLRREGITKADMARRIKAPLQTIYDWCDGTKRPNVDSLIKIADAYDVTLDWLVTGKETVDKELHLDDLNLLVHKITHIAKLEGRFFSPYEVGLALVAHGQQDKRFKWGETIKYSPSEVEQILTEVMQDDRT